MIMAPNGTPIPMPILAELERPNDDDAEEKASVAVPELVAVPVELSVAVPELVAVSVELSDASEVGADLVVDADDSSVVLDLWKCNAVDVDTLEYTIDTCPSVKRLEDSPQQFCAPSLVQQKVPEDSGGQAIILTPPCGFSRIA